jgi:uncharacterized coiled-coil protein SlyX
MTSPAASRTRWYRVLAFGVTMMGIVWTELLVQAADPEQVPWECSNYSDEARTRCLNTYIEHQQEHIAKLERQLQAQQNVVGELKGQVDRQTAATAQLQRQLAQPPVVAGVVPPPLFYPYGFTYPPVGIGLYLGRPWMAPGFYGYYRPGFWGPRFYGHRGRRW